MSESSDKDFTDFLDLLVTEKVISAAQANLVRTDHEATGMTFEEILLARSWVSQETLLKHAPQQSPDVHEPQSSERKTPTYQENLKRYRLIMAEILGESSE